MYGLGPQEFLKQASKNKPGDTSQIQNDKEPGPAKHPNTEKQNTQMNKSGNEDLENNKDINKDKAKVDGGEVRNKTGPIDEGPQEDGFFAKMKKKVKDYVIRKGTEKMGAMMNPEGDTASEGGKESNLANEQSPKENRPKVDKPQRPTRNDPKTKIPQTPTGPVNNTPIPRIPSPVKFKAPKIPRPRM
jgi:hypothetical protein